MPITKETEVQVSKKTPTMKITSITINNSPRGPGLRAGVQSVIDLANPTEPWRGWRAMLKGAMLVLVSPPGWMSGRQPRDWNKDGACTIIEVPRASCCLQWEGDEAVLEQLSKPFTSEPFGKPIEAGELVQPVEKQHREPVNAAEIGDE